MTGTLLAGRTAVVTGASSGLGRAIASRLWRDGADLVIAGRSEAGLDETITQIKDGATGGKIISVLADLRHPAELDALADRAISETGRLNIFVNNAGLSKDGKVASAEFEDWREMFETNVLSLLAGAKAAIRVMRAGGHAGHIVNIGSIGGRREAGGVYGATKAAVDMISDTLRAELEDEDIRVVEILPGAFMTNFGRNFPPAGVNQLLKMMGESYVFEAGAKIPSDVLGRMQKAAAKLYGDPDAVARAVVFAVTQPIEVNVSEIVIRPARSGWRAPVTASA